MARLAIVAHASEEILAHLGLVAKPSEVGARAAVKVFASRGDGLDNNCHGKRLQ